MAALVEQMNDHRHARGGEEPEEKWGEEGHGMRETLDFKFQTPRVEMGASPGFQKSAAGLIFTHLAVILSKSGKLAQKLHRSNGGNRRVGKVAGVSRDDKP